MKKIIVVVILLANTIIYSAGNDAKLQTALELYNQQQLPQSLAIFKNIANETDDIFAVYYYARITYESVSAEQGLRLFERILVEHPEHWETNLYLGRVLAQAQKWQQAVAYFKMLPVGRLAVSDLRLWGQVCLQSNRAYQAKTIYKALTDSPEATPADFFAYGQAAFAAGDYKKALAAFEAVQKAGDNTGKAHYWLARCYYKLRRLLGDASYQYYDVGRFGTIQQGRLLLHQKTPELFYTAAPDSAAYQLVMADFLGYKGAIRFYLAQVWFESGYYSRAIPLYERSIPKLTAIQRNKATFNLSESYFMTGDYEQYRQTVRRLARANPKLSKALYLESYRRLLRAYKYKNNQERYQYYLQKAIESDPHIAGLHREQGYVRWQAGQYRDAWESFSQALKLSPDAAGNKRIAEIIAEMKQKSQI